ATGNLVAAKSLVDAKHVFMLYSDSGTASGGAPYEHDAGVPVVSTPVDIAVATYDNYFSSTDEIPNPKDISPLTGAVFKAIGATTVGALGLQVSEGSINAGKGGVASAVHAGLKAGYVNNTIAVGTSNWTPFVLGMKNSHTDGFYGVMDVQDEFSFLAAAQSQGLNL